MGLNLLPRRRYRVSKYSKISGKFMPTFDPEAKRLFWTQRGAVRELNRLTAIASNKGVPYAYRVQRIHGN